MCVCVCVCVSLGCPLPSPANVALPTNSWKTAAPSPTTTKESAPSPTTTSRRSPHPLRLQHPQRFRAMIYDRETSFYRRFVQSSTPAYDRQRANRIDVQRLLQYGHKITRQHNKDPTAIASSLALDGVDPSSSITRAMLLSIASSLRCRFCGDKDAHLRSCSGCKLARYCSKECQLADWSEHREVRVCAFC